MSNVRFIGLDVHAETIAVAVAEPDGEVRSLGEIPNRSESIRKLVKKLGPATSLRVCYEAGPTGYVVYWQLSALGVKCEVVAPTLVPVKAGDRVKTDRRDAMKLARSYRAGDLTPVWVPDAAHEALRDLVRAREAAKKDQLRARHRLGKFLLRHGRRPSTKMNSWTQTHLTWVKTVHFEQAAQEATLLDYVHEVEHMAGRIERLERAIDEAIKTVPAQMRAVIKPQASVGLLKSVWVFVSLLAIGCGGNGATTSPSPTFVNFQGQYSGTYVISSCSEDGSAVGVFCAAAPFNVAVFAPGSTLPMLLSLNQNQDVVTGIVTLGALSATLQGRVSASGTLSATTTVSTVPISGFLWNITSWNTTLSGNTLVGSFTFVFRETAPVGTGTVNAVLSQVNRSG